MLSRSWSIARVRTAEHDGPKPYADVRRDIEARLGPMTDDILELSQEGRTEELREALVRIAGNDGLARHYTAAHGDLLQLKGRRQPLVAYYIGNVLSAVEMTSVDRGAGLYAPLRVVVYGNEQGGTTFEYDRPSTLFGQFGDPRIDETAASLDQRLDALLRAVSV